LACNSLLYNSSVADLLPSNSVKRHGIIIQALALVAVLAFSLIPFVTAPVTGVTGTFVDSTLVGGLNAPTSMDFSPDGRLFVNEKGGSMRIISNGALLSTPFLTVTVDSTGERGLLGVAFDPNFAANGYVYAYYTATSPTIHNRVSRFTADPANPDRVLAGSELQILNLETLSTATNHNGGAIHFGKDGKLYVAVGDNANSSNSQSLASRLGKILRINSDGTIPSDNPFYNTSGAYKEIWALGLRNPFTFAFSPSPTSTAMYINDVGLNTWEEINSGIKGANYGWPTCEGVCSNTSFVNPIYAYNHNGTGAAITGSAFYESTQFPSDYQGSYFFGDYVHGWIKRLTPTNQLADFLSGLNSPVDIQVGPDGSLYYLSIGGGAVHKVQYTGGTTSIPTAVATASPTSGPPPLTVTFDGTKSSDSDPSATLGYSWNFGDSSPAATGAVVTHTYTAAGPYVATLTVTDGAGGVSTATVNIAVGTPPVGTIITPVEGTTYNAGDTIFFSGSGNDAKDGTLPASAFHWTILFHHNTHTHPFLDLVGIKSGNFTIPTLGETSSDVFYRIYLTVTDSVGLSQTTTRDVIPNKSTITLSSNVPGLQVNLDGAPENTPYSFVGVVGFNRTIGAPDPQSLSGQTYAFSSWSDGGAATHTILTPSTNTTYTENYNLVIPPPTATSTLTINSMDMTSNPMTGYWTVLYDANGNVLKTGFTPVTFTLNAGQQYRIGMGNYGAYYFDHWQDNNATTNPRSVSISSNTQLTAVYRTTSSPSPTSMLTVRSVDATGNPITGYWTVLYDGSNGSVLKTGFTPASFTLNSGQQYRIGMGNYGAYYFDHWQDNNATTNPRSVSINADTTLTGVYRTTP
jgi:glucose/arabinose dehydrogenase